MSQYPPMTDRAIGDYLEALASAAPAPGGGSVAGLVGALAAGLGEMVANLTADAPDELRDACRLLADLRASALASAEADESAYSGYLEASRLPKATPEEKALRRQRMQDAIRHAAEVPLALAETGVRILEQLAPVVSHGNRYVLSDAEIAVTLAQACVSASIVNVRVNLPLIKDERTAADVAERAATHEERTACLVAQLQEALAARRA